MLKKIIFCIGFLSISSSYLFADSDCNAEGGAGCNNIPGWQAPEIVLDSDSTTDNLNSQDTWSGGANLDNDYKTPNGFNLQKNESTLSLSLEETDTDDGVSILSISRPVDPYADVYYTEAENLVIYDEPEFKKTCNKPGRPCVKKSDKQAIVENAAPILEAWNKELYELDIIPVENTVDQWAVTQGETLRIVLEDWAKKAGWDVVWNTTREYPIQASAMFNGRFMDVASALVRNFSRAQPAPYAKFYKGNKVIVIQTIGGGND